MRKQRCPRVTPSHAHNTHPATLVCVWVCRTASFNEASVEEYDVLRRLDALAVLADETQVADLYVPHSLTCLHDCLAAVGTPA